jgi:hypothetical protein
MKSSLLTISQIVGPASVCLSDLANPVDSDSAILAMAERNLVAAHARVVCGDRSDAALCDLLEIATAAHFIVNRIVSEGGYINPTDRDRRLLLIDQSLELFRAETRATERRRLLRFRVHLALCVALPLLAAIALSHAGLVNRDEAITVALISGCTIAGIVACFGARGGARCI